MKILPNGIAVIDGDTHHAEWVAKEGLVHDKWMADNICKHLKPGVLAVDGGANIGTLTRAMIDVGAEVYAFEPNDQARECLVRNCPNAIIHSSALADITKMGSIHLQENAGASYVTEEYPGIDGQAVMLARLDFFSLWPNLIKLDIEGFEVKALRGAQQTILNFRPVLIVEVNRAALERAGDSQKALFDLIEEHGYQWRILQPDCKRDDPQYDIEAIFRP